jgi:hypothetical protein
MPRTNNRLVNQIPQMIEGLERRFAGQTLTVNGVSITCAEAIAQLERVATARAATATARAAWLDQVKHAGAVVASASAMMVGLHDFVRGLYGRSSGMLVDFGMTPAARRARTAARERRDSAEGEGDPDRASHDGPATEGGDSWRTATRRVAAAACVGAAGVTTAAPLQHADRRAPSLEPVHGRRYVAGTGGCTSSVDRWRVRRRERRSWR